MRSWKTPALLATMALGGLGSLFAQGPALPSVPAPTPIGESSVPVPPAPAADAPVSGTNYSEVVAPDPIIEPGERPGAAQLTRPLQRFPFPAGLWKLAFQSCVWQ